MDVITQAGITIGDQKREGKNIFTAISDWLKKSKFILSVFEIQCNWIRIEESFANGTNAIMLISF